MQTEQIYYRQKWKQVQNIANMYWNRWLREYIPTLTPRWLQQTRHIKVGDLVVIKSKYFPQNHWPMRRGIETVAGNDDSTRSIKVQTLPTRQIHVRGIFAKHPHDIFPEYSERVPYEIPGNIPK